ncbi:hypothetical protein BRD00_04305 [Halobacteriales archaeon QS_8_69_26]|nr:MAG: hypothetical protein BRD00_04305 [Halobacteriales archaeon QS_8_69_26]
MFANGVLPPAQVPPALQSDTLAANGLRGRLSNGTTDVRQVLVYESADDVDTDAVLEGSETGDELGGLSVEQSGRAARVEGTVRTENLNERHLFGVTLHRN